MLAAIQTTFSQGDWEGLNELTTPDLVSTDHRPMGYGTLGREGMLEWHRTMREVSPVNTNVFSKIYRSGRCSLASGRNTGHTADDGEWEWSYVLVGDHAADGRLRRLHLFPDDQWAEARTLFDEWSRQPIAET